MVCIMLAGCGDTTDREPAMDALMDDVVIEVNTGIIIDYDTNLIMNRYDIRVFVNDVQLGVQEQGEKTLYELTLTEGLHTLTFREFGNDGNATTEIFEVLADNYFYFFIKARNSGIEIERRDTMTLDEARLFAGISSNDNGDTEIEPTHIPDPGTTEGGSGTAASQGTTQPNFTSEYALRAAVVAFTNYFSNDVWDDDGNDIDASLLHSFADVSNGVLFMFATSEGTWTAKDENTWSVEGLRLEQHSRFVQILSRMRLSPSVIINVSLDVSFDGENYIVSNLSGRMANHPQDNLDWMMDEWSAQRIFTVPPRLIQEGRDADLVTDHRRVSRFATDITTAQRAFDYVGKELFPYGFEADWRRGLEESIQAHDGSWYLKVRVTITNQFNASRTAIAEAVINYSTERVEDFIVDGVKLL
jgi:hypothetical protein